MRRVCGSVMLIVALSFMGVRPLTGQDSADHVVQPGDNLYRLALQYGVTVAALLDANHLTTPGVLIVGQVLVIPHSAAPAPALELPPGARLHTVQPGENLLRIAQYYGVTPEAIMQANALQDPEQIAPGQQLIILPDSASADLGLLSGAPAPAAPRAAAPATPTAAPPVAVPTATPPPTAQPAPPTATATVAARAAVAPLAGVRDPSADVADLGIMPAVVPEAEQEAARLAPPQPAASAAERSAAGSGARAAPAPISAEEQEAARLAAGADPARAGRARPSAPASADPAAQIADLGIVAAGAPAWLLAPELVTSGDPAVVRAIYARGRALGNNPRAFSKVGDCNSEPPFFLARFEGSGYELGPFASLQFVIDYFRGSFARPSMAAWTGNHAWAVFDPTWSNPAYCAAGETPIACEYRVQRPSVALIALGTNEAYTPALFEQHLRHIVEFSIEKGVIPVLGTKADQLEGGDAVNEIIRALAEEYGVPLWDFGRASEALPGRGLQPDGFHLTYVEPYYTLPAALQSGHAIHNLTALLALNEVWRSVLRDAE